jgi:alanine dehydrogenase
VREPVILRGMIRKGTHINAMGADAPGKQELDTNILFDAKVVIDDWDQATHSGEVNVPIHDGTYDPKKIHGTLGEVAIGKSLGRVSDDEITIFDSTGLAIQDVALARVIYAAARAKKLGTEIALVAT